MIGDRASDELCAAVWAASGGNPLYLTELLRAVAHEERPLAEVDPARLLVGGRDAISRRGGARGRGVGPRGAAARRGRARVRGGAGGRRGRGRVRAAPRGGDRWCGDGRGNSSGGGPGSA